MRKWCMLALLLLFVILGNFQGANDETLAQVEQPEPEVVSLVQLIANPKDYHRKFVLVIGFCRLEFEGDALFLHSEDFEQGLTKNALWLDVESPIPESRQKLSDGYVLVEAVFDAEEKGRMDLFSGSLKVKRMQHWPSRKEIEQIQQSERQRQ
jgi:hypothetical protein